MLGASGMLGNAVLRVFAASEGHEIIGSARSASVLRLLPQDLRDRVVSGIDVENVNKSG
jgi:dTDP-4-dehydrorhamnose reductase